MCFAWQCVARALDCHSEKKEINYRYMYVYTCRGHETFKQQDGSLLLAPLAVHSEKTENTYMYIYMCVCVYV